MNRAKLILTAVSLGAIALAVFSPCLKSGFVNWDDDRYVTQNRVVTDISARNAALISGGFFVGHYQPLTVFTFMLEHFFFGANPFAYHLTNIILHSFNCVLVFWLIYLLTGRCLVSWVTAVLFAVHPLQAESVAWISQRKSVLYVFFYLGSLISYIYYSREKENPAYYRVSLSLFLLSLLSKSMAITLPAVLFLVDYFESRRISRRVFAEKIPFAALSLAFLFIAVSAVNSIGPGRYGTCGFFDQLIIISGGIINHLSRLVLPFNLSALYPYYHPRGAYAVLLVLTAVVLAAGVSATVKITKKAVFGSGFFLLTLAPVLQFIPNSEAMSADHHIYLSCVGLFYLVGEGIGRLCSARVAAARFLCVPMFFILAGFIHLTIGRCRVWNDSISLWSDVIKKYPQASTAYTNRSAEFLSREKHAEFLSDSETAIKLDPGNFEAYFNRGSFYYKQKNYEKAAESVKKTLELNPGYKQAYDLLALIYGELGMHKDVIDVCEKAIDRGLGDSGTFVNMCVAYGNLGLYSTAAACGEQALLMDPSHGPAHYHLAEAYYHSGDPLRSAFHSRKAAEAGYDAPGGISGSQNR